MVTEKEAFGSGLGFRQDWDFGITETSSLGTATGLRQLEKKLAYATTKRIIPEIGRPRTEDILEDIRIRIERVAEREPRIESVEKIVVEDSDTDTNKVDVSLTVVADSDEKHTLEYSA